MIDNKTIREVVIADKLFPGGGDPTYEDRTATGAIATVDTNVAMALNSCSCIINPLQEGSGDPSPENPRTIVGFDSLIVTRSTTATDRDFTIALGRTVYGGSAEVVEGTGKITFNEPLKLSSGWIYQGAGVDGGAIFYHTTSDKKANAIGFCEKLEAISSGGWSSTRKGTINFGHSTGLIFVSIDGLTTSTDVNAFMSECKLCYELATPIDFTFTGQEIKTVVGEQTFSHDCNGNIEVSYKYQTGEGGGSKVNKWLPIFYPIRKGDT
ncbi:MAG: hypothetical protein J6R30_08565 [Bacteroidales bacterium]|nr:hypothetical protein [Bacteroidales bacterium]